MRLRGDHRHIQYLAQTAGDLGEGGPGHHGGDGRHLRLVPAEVGGDDVHPLGLQRLGQHDDLFPGQAILQHVHGRDAEDQDEIGPHRRAHPSDDLDRELHPVLERPAPAVGALVGLVHQEGRDEIAGRADDLDAVIAGLFGQHGAVGEVGDLLLDAGFVQFVGGIGGDARPDWRRRHAVGRTGQGAAVQDLHADLHVGVGGVNGLSDDAVLVGLRRRRQLGATAGLQVRRIAAGDDHAHPTAGAGGEELSLALETVCGLLQSGVHRAHQDAVLQLGEAEI